MLEFNRGEFIYSPRFCLSQLNFMLKPGMRVLLAGPNGSGKTTLLKLMAGLLPLHAGKRTSQVKAGGVHLCGHQPALYPSLSVRQNLDFWLDMGARLGKVPPPDRKKREACLAEFDLLEVATEKAGALSRGMAQRLVLSRICLAAAENPCLLLLDEPETGLEPKYLALFQTHILNLSQAATVWASHAFSPDKNTKTEAANGVTPFTHTFLLKGNPERSGEFSVTLYNYGGAGEPC